MRDDNMRYVGWLAGAALVLAGACSLDESPRDAGPAPGQVQAPTLGTVLAVVTTEAGLEYTFMEPAPGEVALEIKASGPVDSVRFPGPETSLAELYRSLSGQPAPRALVLAEERAAENRLAGEDCAADQDLSPGFSPGDAVQETQLAVEEPQTRDMTAGEFRANYCPRGSGDWDFLYCWPDTSGNPWVARTSEYMAGAMHATTCTTRFRYRRGNTTFVDRQALPGETFWYWTSGGCVLRRWEILGNAGCGVRFSAWGDNC